MTTKSNTGRRTFLAALGVGGAAAAAVAVTQGSRETAPAATDATPQGKGYQVTEHVQKYYRTAKV